MHICMDQSLYDTLLSYGYNKLPNEACGFITGSRSEDQLKALAFVPITNISAKPREHFIMNPAEVIGALMNRSTQIIGVFHTHPEAEAILSQEDLQTLWHTIPTHWILSFSQAGNPVLHVYKITIDRHQSSQKPTFAIDG